MMDILCREPAAYKGMRNRAEIEGLISHLTDGTVKSIRPDTLTEIVRFLKWVLGNSPDEMEVTR